MPISDPMGRLDRLTTVMERASTRRAFLSDPWLALTQAGIERPTDADDPFNVLVDSLAEMSFEELGLIGRFGEGIRGVLGPVELLF